MVISPKLRKDLEDALMMIMAIKWDGFSKAGSCIPISYALNEFMNLRSRPSRVAETTMEAHDPLNARWLQIEPTDWFLGHVVVVMPIHGLLLDGSLWTQTSKVLDNFDMPKLLIAHWNQKLGHATGHIDRLTIRYEPDLSAHGWKTRSWPFTEIREAVISINKDMQRKDW
ncbi:hypothetical protein LCGC14_1055470 [marine sediment metagenome]|uniref:Uncharacterized protein n=1 Tax=marine sediment metagenome TaxID=412755 RepID=A0A0F9MMN7_9ZZZZ